MTADTSHSIFLAVEVVDPSPTRNQLLTRRGLRAENGVYRGPLRPLKCDKMSQSKYNPTPVYTVSVTGRDVLCTRDVAYAKSLRASIEGASLRRLSLNGTRRKLRETPGVRLRLRNTGRGLPAQGDRVQATSGIVYRLISPLTPLKPDWATAYGSVIVLKRAAFDFDTIPFICYAEEE